VRLSSAGLKFEAKLASIKIRVPKPLFDAVRERAKLRGIPYTRLIRQLMESDVSRNRVPHR